jgi:hypothetical protein
VNLSHMPLTVALFDAILGAYPEDLDPPDVERALARAGEIGLFAPMYRYLRLRGRQTSPGADARWQRHVARIAMLGHEASELASLLGDQGVIFLKGDLLSQTLYGDRFMRESGDIDLLLDPEHLDEILARLHHRGYRPEPGTGPMPWVSNQFPVYHEQTGITVELHWAIAYPYVPSPQIGEILSRHRVLWTDPEQGRRAMLLEPQMLLLQLCYHFHQHAGFLKGLVDIAGWIDRFDSQTDGAFATALGRELGVSGLLQWPALAIEALTGRRTCLHPPDPDPWARMWAAWTVGTARGVLSAQRPIADWASVAFKTQNMSSAHKMAWALAGLTALDGYDRKLSAIRWMIFRDPRTLAASEGRQSPTPTTYLKLGLRPAILVARQLSEWIADP